MKYFEHIKRSLAKTITYRILIIISTSTTVYAFTKDVSTTSVVTFVGTVANTIIYYLHERVWNGIHWGKHKK